MEIKQIIELTTIAYNKTADKYHENFKNEIEQKDEDKDEDEDRHCVLGSGRCDFVDWADCRRVRVTLNAPHHSRGG